MKHGLHGEPTGTQNGQPRNITGQPKISGERISESDRKIVLSADHKRGGRVGLNLVGHFRRHNLKKIRGASRKIVTILLPMNEGIPKNPWVTGPYSQEEPRRELKRQGNRQFRHPNIPQTAGRNSPRGTGGGSRKIRNKRGG